MNNLQQDSGVTEKLTPIDTPKPPVVLPEPTVVRIFTPESKQSIPVASTVPDRPPTPLENDLEPEIASSLLPNNLIIADDAIKLEDKHTSNSNTISDASQSTIDTEQLHANDTPTEHTTEQAEPGKRKHHSRHHKGGHSHHHKHGRKSSAASASATNGSEPGDSIENSSTSSSASSASSASSNSSSSSSSAPVVAPIQWTQATAPLRTTPVGSPQINSTAKRLAGLPGFRAPAPPSNVEPKLLERYESEVIPASAVPTPEESALVGEKPPTSVEPGTCDITSDLIISLDATALAEEAKRVQEVVKKDAQIETFKMEIEFLRKELSLAKDVLVRQAAASAEETRQLKESRDKTFELY